MKEGVGINNCFIAFLLTISGCNDNSGNEVSSDVSSRAILQQDRWPEFLLEFGNSATVPATLTSSLVVYQLDNDEYVFRSDDSDELLALFSSRWELSRVEKNQRFVKQFLTRIPRSDITDDNEFFANPNRRAGEKGPQIVVCRSTSRRSIVGHYYFNF